jgi:hypothetical protein
MGGVNQITITVKAGAPSAAELELAEGREQHYAGDAETDTSTAAKLEVVTGVNYEDYDVDATYATELQLQQDILSQTKAGNYERVSELMAKQKKGKPSPVVRARRLQMSADSASLKPPAVQTRLTPQKLPPRSSPPAKKCDSTCHDKTDLLAENAALKAQIDQLQLQVDILSGSKTCTSFGSAGSQSQSPATTPGPAPAPAGAPAPAHVRAPSPPVSGAGAVYDRDRDRDRGPSPISPGQSSLNPSPLVRVRRLLSPSLSPLSLSPPPGA